MDAAEPILPIETEPLPWTEICARYPDQFVCLVDIVRVPPRSGELKAARVVGHGPTHDAAFEPIRDLPKQYPPLRDQVHGDLHEAADPALAGHR